jgi:hypothetical protein
VDPIWRNRSSWQVLGADPHERIEPPRLPKRPQVRVRALGRGDGSPLFCLDGKPVQPGETVLVGADDIEHLLASGKVERI